MTTSITTVLPRAKYRRAQGRDSTLNHTMQEIIADLNELQVIWNQMLVPLLEDLPHTADEPVDAFDGLGGDTVYSDKSANSNSSDLFWSPADGSVSGRKKTLKESLIYLNTQLKAMYAELAALINAVEAGDVDTTTLENSIARNNTRIKQVAQDMMGEEYWPLINGDTGTQSLDYPIGQLVKVLLELHGGSGLLDEYSFDASDPTLSHSIPLPDITQTDVDNSADYTPLNRVVATTLQDDLNRLRWEIAYIKGQNWNADVNPGYLGGPVTLDGHLTSMGSGTGAGTNPHGLRYDDITGLNTILTAIRDFTGQNFLTDAAPTYSSTEFVTNGDSLETAIGKLDNALYDLANYGHETLQPQDMLITDGSTPVAGGTLTFYTSPAGSTHRWTQESVTLAQEGAEPDSLSCHVTPPRSPDGTYPTKVRVYMNVVPAVNASGNDIDFIMRLQDYQNGGNGSPAIDGDSLSTNNAPEDTTVNFSGFSANEMHVIDFGTINMGTDGAVQGQLNFYIQRVAGDSVAGVVHVLSVGVDWYGPVA